MTDRDIAKSPTRKDNPVLPDEPPTRPGFATGVDPERPEALVEDLKKIDGQDLRGEGELQPRPWGLGGDDEGPLGDGGQLRESNAAGGGR